jgi:MGT family glycosyltransferase
MARFLFVVPPLAGHVNPTIAVGRALLAEGHEVAWAGCGTVVRALLPADLKLLAVSGHEASQVSEAWKARARSVFGLESFKFFIEDFLIPLAHAMVPGVRAAVDAFEPDLIVCDQQALAGAIAARLEGVPWVTLATTSASVFNSIEQFPKIQEWMRAELGRLQDSHGLERLPRPDLSDKLVIIFSARALVHTDAPIPGHFRFVGPSIRGEADAGEFPWESLDESRRKVYLSLGTLNAARSARFYEKVKEAFAGTELQLIVSAPPELLGEVPGNFVVRGRVPQLELLKRVDAVIFHGGHNTFCEALFNGLPLVVAPIKDDQPVIADQVVRSGAGVRVHFDRVKSSELREATHRVLDEPEFKQAALRARKILQEQGGATEAGRLLISAERGMG